MNYIFKGHERESFVFCIHCMKSHVFGNSTKSGVSSDKKQVFSHIQFSISIISVLFRALDWSADKDQGTIPCLRGAFPTCLFTSNMAFISQVIEFLPNGNLVAVTRLATCDHDLLSVLHFLPGNRSHGDKH